MPVMFRYDLYGDVIALNRFSVVRLTPKGAWVRPSWTDIPRWVSNTSTKRLCHPTVEEAWVSFYRRKERQLLILNRQIAAVRDALAFCQAHKDRPPADYTPIPDNHEFFQLADTQ